MAGAISRLMVIFGVDLSPLKAGTLQANKIMADAAKNFNAQTGGFKALSGAMSEFGQRATLGMSLPLAAVGASALKAAADLEVTQKSFRALVKDTAQADKLFKSVVDFSQKNPFELKGLQDTTKRILAFGFAATEATQVLKGATGAAAAFGAGADYIDRVVLALGQIKQKGTVQAQEMRQLAEAGIPAWQILAEILGKDIPGAMKAVEDRTVMSATLLPKLIERMGKDADQIVKARAETLIGQYEIAKNKVTLALAEVGANMIPLAKQAVAALDPILEATKSMAAGFKELPAPIQAVAGAFGGLLVAGPPVIWLLGQLGGAILNLKLAWAEVSALSWMAAFGKGSALVIGIGVAVAAVDVLINKLKDIGPASNQFFAGWRSITSGNLLNDLNKVNSERKGTLTGEVAAAKDYTHQIDIATVSMDKLTAAGERFLTVASKPAPPPVDPEAIKAATKELERQNDEYLKLRAALVADFATPQQKAVNDYIEVMNRINELTRISVEKRNELMEKAQMAFLQSYGDLIREENKRIIDDLEAEWEEFVETRKSLFNLPTAEDPLQKIGEPGLNGVPMPGQLPEVPNPLPDILKQGKEQIKIWGRDASRAMQEVSTVVTDLSRGIADAIVNAKSLGDVFKKVAKDIAAALIRYVIQGGIQKVLQSLGGLIAKVPGLGGLGSIFSGTFGGAASAAGSIGGSAAGAAGGLGGSASSIGKAIGGSVASTLNTVFSGISAVTGIVGLFQGAKANKLAGLTEQNTRYTAIQAQIQQDTFNKYLPELANIRGLFQQIITTGVGVFNQPGDYGLRIAAASQGPGGTFGGGGNFTWNIGVVAGDAGISGLVDLFVAELQRRGLKIG